jgi:hypothetical protein
MTQSNSARLAFDPVNPAIVPQLGIYNKHPGPISSASLDVLQHRIPEHIVEPGLIASSLAAEPSHHIGVKAHGELLLHRPVERITDSVFPKSSL